MFRKIKDEKNVSQNKKRKGCSAKLADNNGLKMCLKMSYLFKNDFFYLL